VTGSASASVEVFADLHTDVGEAPHWDEKRKTVLFVDLTAGAVFRYDELGVKVGSFSPFGLRPYVMAGVAHPSGVMLPVTSNAVVLVYPLPTSPMPSPAVSRKSGDSGA
jgi:sugar lactone lactonase YvrE